MVTIDRKTRPRASSLVLMCAIVDLVLVSAIAAVQREREAFVLALVLVGALVLRRVGRGPVGAVVLALVFADIAFWMLPAAVSGLSHRDPWHAAGVSVLLSGASLVGLTGQVAHLIGARAANAPVIAGGAVVVLVLVLLGGSLIRTGHGTTAASAGTVTAISARDTTFSAKELTVPAGRVTIRFTNHDLFWHTFTVRGLPVNMDVPVGGTRQATFVVQPGTYTFSCRIPGHEKAGMKGTLIVR